MTSEASPDAVKFSTIVGVNKCSAETLERAHEHGIDFDLDISAPLPDVEVK